jgi:putative nucleotidyltransferase with HDIG domain
MSHEISHKLTNLVDHMPAFSKSVREILVMTRDANCSPKDVVRVIEADQLVTNKVLRVVNSAFCDLPKAMPSINHAVVYLGLNTIKNLAVSLATFDMLPSAVAAGFDAQRYMVHSLSTAGIARQLALHVAYPEPMDCMIAGMLHDIGKLVFARFMPKEFRLALETSIWNETPLHQALNDVIGAEHAVVGAMLVEKWRFPQELIETIRNQYHPYLNPTQLTACVFAANKISKRLELDDDEVPPVEELPTDIADLLGGDLNDVVVALGDLSPVLEEARSYAGI